MYAEGVAKPALDEAWGEAFKAFARSGNSGDVDKGVWVEDGYWTSEPGRGGGTEAG